MNKSESKYFNTAQRMDEALIALLEQKPLEYITVRDICAKAGVSRSTFYLHYETIDDLLSECVEHTNAKFLSYFEESVEGLPNRIMQMPLEELVFIRPEYLIPYLRFIYENRTMFRAAIGSPQGMQSVGKYEKMYLHIFEPVLKRFDYPEEHRKYAISFYVNGIVAIIKEWLEGGCCESIETVADIIIGCIRPEQQGK